MLPIDILGLATNMWLSSSSHWYCQLRLIACTRHSCRTLVLDRIGSALIAFIEAACCGCYPILLNQNGTTWHINRFVLFMIDLLSTTAFAMVQLRDRLLWFSWFGMSWCPIVCTPDTAYDIGLLNRIRWTFFIIQISCCAANQLYRDRQEFFVRNLLRLFIFITAVFYPYLLPLRIKWLHGHMWWFIYSIYTIILKSQGFA